MMKSFSTVRDTQRDSQCYMEKRRGRREIEVTMSDQGLNQHPLHCKAKSQALEDQGSPVVTVDDDLWHSPTCSHVCERTGLFCL